MPPGLLRALLWTGLPIIILRFADPLFGLPHIVIVVRNLLLLRSNILTDIFLPSEWHASHYIFKHGILFEHFEELHHFFETLLVLLRIETHEFV